MRATTAAAVLALTAASATAQSVGSPLDIARNLLNLYVQSLLLQVHMTDRGLLASRQNAERSLAT